MDEKATTQIRYRAGMSEEFEIKWEYTKAQV